MANELGSLYRSSLAVTDAANAPIDAATAILTVTLPDGTVATPAVTHDGVGAYHSDYLFTQEGLHKFVWVTTSPSTSRTDYVNANVFRSIVGIDEAKNFINYGNSTNEDALRQIMQAATEMCEGVVGSCVQRTLTNVRIPGRYKAAIRLPDGPLPSASSVISVSSSWPNGPVWTYAAGDFVISPEVGIVELSSLASFWMGPWDATYTVGRKVVPQSIQLAAKEIIYDMWSTQRPFGADELEPGPEATARFEQLISMYTIPAHAKALLTHYEMPGFG